MNDKELTLLAQSLVHPMKLSREDMDAATVGCAILAHSGKVYTGVCISVSCGMGFCAEHAAIAEMIKGKETKIKVIVAAHEDGVIAPCGRCREFMKQIDNENLKARVLLENNRSAKLEELLPQC